MFEKIFKAAKKWNQRSIDRAALANMDERLCRDIGIEQHQPQLMVKIPFWLN